MENTIRERYWSKVIKGNTLDDCWDWNGGFAHFGYGSMKVNGKMDRAHRISWRIHNGEIPKGKLVLHNCDNPPCSNPKHLSLGTQSDNIRDAYSRYRATQKGSKNNMSKLTEAKVYKIRSLYRRGILQRELAKQFGVIQQTISLIVNDKRWVK